MARGVVNCCKPLDMGIGNGRGMGMECMCSIMLEGVWGWSAWIGKVWGFSHVDVAIRGSAMAGDGECNGRGMGMELLFGLVR